MPNKTGSEVLRNPCALALGDEPLASAVEHGPMQLRVEAAQVGIPLHHFIDSEIWEQPARCWQSTTFADKDEFLAAMTPVAKEVAEDLGISHKIVLAQAALESGWGSKVKGNNLMGIKSHGEEGGVDVVTHEVVNGKRVKITDSFRAYDTPKDSIRGYGKFLKANSRYKHFLRAGAENEDAQLSALQTSGYATDPVYSQKLKNIIKGLPDEEGQG